MTIAAVPRMPPMMNRLRRSRAAGAAAAFSRCCCRSAFSSRWVLAIALILPTGPARQTASAPLTRRHDHRRLVGPADHLRIAAVTGNDVGVRPERGPIDLRGE